MSRSYAELEVALREVIAAAIAGADPLDPCVELALRHPDAESAAVLLTMAVKGVVAAVTAVTGSDPALRRRAVDCLLADDGDPSLRLVPPPGDDAA